MTIDKNKTRKEVHLLPDIIEELQKQADAEGRTLKNYMEYILTQQSKRNIKK